MLATFQSSSPARSANLFVRAAIATGRGIWHVLAWPARVAHARRDFALLAGMSEHELHDIGLASQDIASATALHPDEDATTFLAGRARERRAHAGRHR